MVIAGRIAAKYEKMIIANRFYGAYPTHSGPMFAVRASYLSLLEAVVARCGLPYASVVFEMAGDGSPIYGVEVDVPYAGAVAPCRSVFF